MWLSWSPSLSRLLQPVVCVYEGLGVTKARPRPFHIEPSRPEVSVQEGETPQVCPSLGVEQRLDGVSGSQGHLLAHSNSSGQPQVSQVLSLQLGLPVQGSVFRSLHYPSSLHEGHGSGVTFPPSCWNQDSSISG